MTQVGFPSQKKTRVRARAQTPYPTAAIKRLSANFQPAVPQILNGNLKYRSFSTYKIPVIPSPELANFNKLLVNTNQGLLNSDRVISSSNKERLNIGHALVNPSHTVHANHLLVNCKKVNINSYQQTSNSRPDPVNCNYGIDDTGNMLGPSDHEILNSNQILMNFNSGMVNYSNGPLQSNHRLVNSNDLLVDCNQDVENSSNELINFEASVINPNYGSSYCKTIPPNSSPWSETTNSLLLESNAATYPQWTHINPDYRHDNCSPELVRSNVKRATSRPGLVWSDSNYKDLRTDQVKSESVPSNYKAVLNRSDSKPEEYRTELCRSISRPEESGSEFLVSSSRPYDNPKFTGSNYRPSDCKPVFIRSNSKPGYDRSDSRQAEFRSVLARSESWHNDAQVAIRNMDCRNVRSTPVFLRSNSRPSDANTEFVRSQSITTDTKPGLATPHPGFSHPKSTSTSKGLSQSTLLRRNRSPPPCTCPQCLLVQSIKSASWPGRQLQTSESWNNGHQRQKDKNITRVPPLPLYNIEGSGVIPPVLAGISGLLMSAVGLPVCLSVPASPIFRPPPVKKRDLRPVPGIQGTSRKITNKKVKKTEEIIKQFLQRVRSSPSEDCASCRRTLTEGEVGRLYRCAHAYHVRCLASLYKDGTLRCPTCQTLYGVKIGSQPPGKMTFHVIPHSLPGYPDCETIRIIYQIAPGVQGSGQPNPGMKFTAPDFPLHCYLPNIKKGREVLLLLVKAWESRLLFPVLPSRLTGVLDSVSISRIPLKTEFGSNVTGKGFPDSRYLDRILRQLQDWGVSAD